MRSSARGAGGLGVLQGGSCYSEGTPRESERELKAGLLVYSAGRPKLWLSATPPRLWILFDNINVSVYFIQWC